MIYGADHVYVADHWTDGVLGNGITGKSTISPLKFQNSQVHGIGPGTEAKKDQNPFKVNVNELLPILITCTKKATVEYSLTNTGGILSM